jgi:hypothetical protein
LLANSRNIYFTCESNSPLSSPPISLLITATPDLISLIAKIANIESSALTGSFCDQQQTEKLLNNADTTHLFRLASQITSHRDGFI